MSAFLLAIYLGVKLLGCLCVYSSATYFFILLSYCSIKVANTVSGVSQALVTYLGGNKYDDRGFLNKFIYLFLAVLGLRCCTRAFSICGRRGLLFVVVRGLLTTVASLVAEHGL